MEVAQPVTLKNRVRGHIALPAVDPKVLGGAAVLRASAVAVDPKDPRDAVDPKDPEGRRDAVDPKDPEGSAAAKERRDAAESVVRRGAKVRRGAAGSAVRRGAKERRGAVESGVSVESAESVVPKDQGVSHVSTPVFQPSSPFQSATPQSTPSPRSMSLFMDPNPVATDLKSHAKASRSISAIITAPRASTARRLA